MFLLFALFSLSVVESELNLFTQVYVWPDKHLEKQAHLEAVFEPSPGLWLLVKCVLLVPPCYEEMKKQGFWTRLRLSWRRGARFNARWWFKLRVWGSLSCAFKLSTSLCRFSSSPRQSLKPKLSKTKKLHCHYAYLTLKQLTRRRFYHQVNQRRSRAPRGPRRKHLSSGLLRDAALVMCPLRLLSSCPTSLPHCSIRLSTPGLCLSSSLSLNTSSGKTRHI